MPWRALLHSALYRSAVRTRNAQSERTYSGTCTGKEVGLTHVPPATENGGLDGWYRLPRPEQGVCRARVSSTRVCNDRFARPAIAAVRSLFPLYSLILSLRV